MDSTSGAVAEQAWNCLSCRRRKVRCDRCRPCANCVKGQRECVFPTAGRLMRRSERPASLSAPISRQAELTDRIRRLEAVVDSLNTELESQHARQPDERPPPPASLVITEERGGLYIGDRFWTSLRQEIRLVRESFELQKDEPDSDSSFAPALLLSQRNSSLSNSSFIFKMKASEEASTTLDDLRPLPSQMLFIWQTYQDSVAPLVLVLHAPTVTKMIRDCQGRIELLGPNVEPLMFAISTAALHSLTEDEVRVTFQRDKDDFIAQLRLGTERALARADFITTSSLSVLQAAVLHLFTLLKDESSRYTWSLLGLLVRIAISMGLHRDGTFFPDMRPLEIEVRRRIWWFVCFLETRCWDSLGNSEIAGIGVAARGFDTREPLNINDEDIDETMTEFPPARTGYADATMTLMRCDIWRLFQTIKFLISRIGTSRQEPSSSSSDDNIVRLLDRLRSFKDIWSSRIDWQAEEHATVLLVGYMARVHADSLELVARLYRQPHTHGDEPDGQAFASARAILDDYHTLVHHTRTQRISWIIRGQVHWQPLAIVLSRIGSPKQPWDTDSEHVWKVVRELLADVSQAVQADPLWLPLCRLMTRAQNNRSRTLGGTTTADKPTETRQDGAEPPPSPRTDYTRMVAPLSRLSRETTSMAGLISPPSTTDLSSRDAGSRPVGHDPGRVVETARPAESSGPPGLDGGAAMNLSDMDAELGNMEWEDWDEILRTNGQSLLWCLGAI